MKKFEYMELHAYEDHRGTGEILLDLSENLCLKDYGYDCIFYNEDESFSVEQIREYRSNPENFPSIDEVLNQLGQHGWECFSIRAIQSWIANLPQITYTDLNVSNLIHERQLSLWLKREISES